MNTNTNPAPSTSTATKLARAAHRYSNRANHLAGGLVGGIGAAAVKGSGGGIGAAAFSGMSGSSLSAEAAREMLSERKEQLGAVMSGFLRSKAGPVK